MWWLTWLSWIALLYNFSPPFTQQWDSPMAKETDQNDDDWLVTTIEQFDFCPASEQTSIFSNIRSSNLIPRQEFRMGLEGRESSPKSNEQIMMHFCKTQKRSLISVKNFFFWQKKKLTSGCLVFFLAAAEEKFAIFFT